MKYNIRFVSIGLQILIIQEDDIENPIDNNPFPYLMIDISGPTGLIPRTTAIRLIF